MMIVPVKGSTATEMISIGSVELSNALLIDARAPLTDAPFDPVAMAGRHPASVAASPCVRTALRDDQAVVASIHWNPRRPG